MAEERLVDANALAPRLDAVRSRIAAACSRCGRLPEEVKLVAVSKVQPLAKIRALIDCGHLVFGENYVQEAEEKIHALVRDDSRPRAEFHLIGHLQSNKVKRAVGLFDVIETVDRPKLLREIAKIAAQRGRTQRILVQVNASGEASKHGAAPEETQELCMEAAQLPALQLEGLMCIGRYFSPQEDDARRRQDFKLLRELRDEVEKTTGLELPQLSMGMSADFELAIEEGASIVRVGSALLGEREVKGTGGSSD